MRQFAGPGTSPASSLTVCFPSLLLALEAPLPPPLRWAAVLLQPSQPRLLHPWPRYWGCCISASAIRGAPALALLVGLPQPQLSYRGSSVSPSGSEPPALLPLGLPARKSWFLEVQPILWFQLYERRNGKEFCITLSMWNWEPELLDYFLSLPLTWSVVMGKLPMSQFSHL